MAVPFRDTEQLAAIHRIRPRHVLDALPREHLGPPLDLFECEKEHARRHFGPHREPPLPFLTRYDIHNEKAEIVDGFFHWYSKFPSELTPRSTKMDRGQACLIEVIEHGSYLPEPPRDPPPRQTLSSRLTSSSAAPPHQLLRSENESPMYFIEDPQCHFSFERLAYGKRSTRRTHKLELLHCTLLKCKEHGCSWEVNVLGQKVNIDKEAKIEEGSDGTNEMEEIKEKIHRMQNRLEKLEVKIEKPKKSDVKDNEAKEEMSPEKVDK